MIIFRGQNDHLCGMKSRRFFVCGSGRQVAGLRRQGGQAVVIVLGIRGGSMKKARFAMLLYCKMIQRSSCKAKIGLFFAKSRREILLNSQRWLPLRQKMILDYAEGIEELNNRITIDSYEHSDE